MKRFLFTFMAIMFFVMQGWTQTTLNEGFEGTTFPPVDWTKVTTQGSVSWQRDIANSPMGTACASVMYQDPNHTNYLITPKLSVTTGLDTISFWIKTDEQYAGTTFSVLVSTTDNQVLSFNDNLYSLVSANTGGGITTTWTKHSVVLTNYVGQNIYVAFKVVDAYGLIVMLDDVTGPNLFVPTCPKPTALNTSNITTTNAQIGWTDATGTLWNIQYMLDTTNNWSNATNISGVTSNPYTIQGLNPATQYKARVQRDCTTEQSEWSAITTFFTNCESISDFPWTEGFETTPWAAAVAPGNALAPNCWLNIDGGYQSSSFKYIWKSTTTAAYVHSGIGAAQMYTSSTKATNDWLITPPITLNGNERLRFWAKGYSTYADQIGVRIYDITTHAADLTLVTDTTLFTEIMPNTLVSATEWTEYEINLSQYSGDYRIAFVRNTIGGYFLNLDDISISTIPSCARPSAITSNSCTQNSIDLSWTNGNASDNAWYIYYAPTGTTTYDSVLATSNPFNLTDLNASEIYDIYMRTVCGSDLSEATNISTFYTACGAITSFPWAEGFESNWTTAVAPGNQFSPHCWTVVDKGCVDGGSQYWWKKGTSTSTILAHTGSGYAVCYTDYGTTGHNDWLITPQLYLTGNERLSFWAMRNNSTSSEPEEISVYISNENAVLDTTSMGQYGNMPNFTQVFNQMLPVGDWQQYEINLSAYTGNHYIAFVRQNTPDGHNLRLDDVLVYPIPACTRPSYITPTNFTSNSVDLGWVNGSQTDASWYVYWKPTSSSIWDSIHASSNPFTLSNLTASTSYDVYIKTDCSSDLSEASNTITFQSTCEALTVPTIMEEFNTFLPSTCWEKKYGLMPATGTATLSPSSSYGWNNSTYPMQTNSGNNAYLHVGNTCYYWLITPSYNLGDGTTTSQLEFDVLLSNYTATGAPSTTGIDDKFAVVISTDNGGSWNVSNAFIWSNQVGATRIYNNLYPLQHVILPLIDSTSTPYSGLVRIAFYGESTITNADNYIHLDNVQIVPFSPCQRPTSLIASNITSTDATISFVENGISTAWQYVISDGTITDPNNGTSIPFSTDSLQLTGLQPHTIYNVWLRSDCSTDTSLWSAPITFRTEALPVVPPYTCDFENSEEQLAWNNISPTVNKWAIGSAAGNGNTVTGTKANYISNNNGASYGMSDGYIYSYTYRDIDFGTDPAASYNLSFDWKCQGYLYQNSLEAGLRVYLRDPSDVINLFGLPINPNDNLGSFYNTSSWQTAHIPIDSISGIKRLIFVYFDPYYNVAPPAAIDNISLVQSTCIRPFNIVASNLTTTTADISWPSTSADSYVLSYRQSSSSTVIDVATITPMVNLTNLTLGTQYICSVKAICGIDTTFASQSITFQTRCVDNAISQYPYIDDFSSGINCWVSNGVWQLTSSGLIPEITPHSPSNMLSYYGSDPGYLISSEFNIPTMPIFVNFWMLRDTLFYMGHNEYVEILVNSTQSEIGATSLGLIHRDARMSPIETVTGWHEYSFTIPDSITGSRYFIIKAQGTNGFYIYIDDFSVISLGCAIPTSLTLPTATITNTTAIVNWTAGGQETAWQVRLGVNGTPIDVTTTSYQLTGLAVGSNDTVYVRANCGGTYSSWVSLAFTTNSGYQLPTVTTAQQTGTNQTSTTLNGSYIQGTNPILVKGFQWKESSASAWNTVPVSAGTTPFVYSLNGLVASTQYDFRAYVETSLDTTYGSTIQFTTLANVLPTVTTTATTNTTQSSATFNGTTAQGTEPIQARGFEYKQTSTSTWTGAIDVTASGTTTILANVTGLTANTQYDVRAYAQTQTDNRNYGNIETFKTDSVSGLSDIDANKFSVTMYPNPTTNTTKLVVIGVEGETDIVINDVQGKLIYKTTAKAVNGKVEQTIDVNNFAKGVYYVRIQNQTTSRTQKLIVID